MAEITEAQLVEWEAEHEDFGGYCQACIAPYSGGELETWPCEKARLIHALRAAREPLRDAVAERRLVHIALRIGREGLLPGYREALQEAAILLADALAAQDPPR